MPKIIPDVLKNLFKKPFTLKYPHERREPPEKFRGKPEIDREKCVSCGQCARVCPAWAITYDEEQKPIIDLGRCIFCGECAEVCPTNAIVMTKKYELATFDKDDLESK
ncbi:MAG: NADH-quinone oxidoreductase subunit I [Hadesarchaea archaeon]|nr:NADH-quinone oxidoreductase subunit I [Hadesarchaea archaeon]